MQCLQSQLGAHVLSRSCSRPPPPSPFFQERPPVDDSVTFRTLPAAGWGRSRTCSGIYKDGGEFSCLRREAAQGARWNDPDGRALSRLRRAEVARRRGRSAPSQIGTRWAIGAGVVMLTWPMGADQYTDAKLLVDQLGVAIRACEAPGDAVPDPARLARALAESLDGTRPERGRIERLSKAAADAVDGGSSDADLDGFVKSLTKLQCGRSDARVDEEC
ncbi:hypothetical protein NL676_029224 [Syzygium grande]|nr:hypothetical protein NL676_029224 [Syzygium grande]